MGIRNLQLSPEITAKLGAIPVEDITDKLPINPKNSWAQLAGTRNIDALTTIAIHHDAWPKSVSAQYTDMQLASKIASDHIANTAYDRTGEGGMPYHLWLRNGRIYQCNDLLDFTYGVGGNNPYTVHICVSGDFYNYDAMSEGERNSLYAAILMVKGALPNYKEFKGHKEFPGASTVCPGIDLNRVRSDLPTIEVAIQQEQTWKWKNEQIAALGKQFKFLNGLLALGENNGDAVWAMEAYLGTYEYMKSKGWA